MHVFFTYEQTAEQLNQFAALETSFQAEKAIADTMNAMKLAAQALSSDSRNHGCTIRVECALVCGMMLRFTITSNLSFVRGYFNSDNKSKESLVSVAYCAAQYATNQRNDAERMSDRRERIADACELIAAYDKDFDAEDVPGQMTRAERIERFFADESVSVADCHVCGRHISTLDVPSKQALSYCGDCGKPCCGSCCERETLASRCSLCQAHNRRMANPVDVVTRAMAYLAVREYGSQTEDEGRADSRANTDAHSILEDTQALFSDDMPTVGTLEPTSCEKHDRVNCVECASVPAEVVEPVKFPRSFGDGSGYVCDGDTIEVEADGFTIQARIERDDTSDAPDERQDGFWPSDDPKDDGFIGDGYQLTEDELSESFEFVNHGVKHSQYFQGCGVSGTDFEEVYTGIGASYREALSDAFEQACTSEDFHQSQIDAIEKAIEAESDEKTVPDESEDQTSEVWHHASIRYTLASPIIKAKAHAQRIMDTWKADEWWYVGVVLSVSKNGIMLDNHVASVWGIECNFPTLDDKLDNSYLTDTANELLSEAIEAGQRIIESLTK